MSRQKIYEVEIQSQNILKMGKKSFITYFQGGHKKRIVSNVKILYPQFFEDDSTAVVHITAITYKEYKARLEGKQITQTKQLIETNANILRSEDYEVMAD